MGLDELAQHRFDQLSFGEQQVALLARAMVKSPPLLIILDEPCIGLDGVYKQQFLALVDHIAAHGHTQILFVSHIVEELPACINQWLQLVPHTMGGHTARVSDVSPQV